MELHFFVFALFITSTVTLTFALRSWPHGNTRTSYFSWLLGALSLGTFSYAMELWGGDETIKFFWLIVKYLSFEFTAFFWLIFVFRFTGNTKWLRPLYLALQGVIPLLSLLVIGSTRQTGWIFQNLHLYRENFIIFENGPYFWVHTLYLYSAFTLGFIYLFRWFRRKNPTRVYQQLCFLTAIGLPFFANLIVLWRPTIGYPVDLTPLSMALGCLGIGWCLFGFNLSEVNPIAREALLESLKDGVIVMDTQHIITDMNPAAYHLLFLAPSPKGKAGKEPVGEGQLLEHVLPVPITLPSLDLTDTYPHQEFTITGPEGFARTLDLRASPLLEHGRFLRGWLLLLRDITEQKQLQNELKKQSRRNGALAEIELAINQPRELTGVLKKIVDITHEFLPAPGGATILTWNEAKRTFEHADSTLPAEQLSYLLHRAKQGQGSASSIIIQQKPCIVPDTHEEPFYDQEAMQSCNIRAYVGLPLIVNTKVVGVLYANDNRPHNYTDDDLHFLQTLANRASIAIYRVQQFTEVQLQAITDHLTGVLNRRQLFNLGELEFRRARRFNRPLSAIMLDIDHFKKINDTYGHARGDNVLIALTQFLKPQLREFDILGRYGGEEFVIILPGANFNSARNVAYRLRQGVQERPILNGTISITISLGVAELTEKISNFSSLINEADLAMYEAKRAGRNRVAWLE